MRQFIAFVKKEFYHILRDTRTMLILIAMPIIQIILFGFAISNEVKNVSIAVLDPSNDISTQRIIEQLGTSEYFNITDRLTSIDEIEPVFKRGKVKLIVAFTTNFNEDLLHSNSAAIQMIADATDPNQSKLLVGYASNIIMDYQKELLQNHSIPLQIVPEIKMLYNPHMKSAYNFVPGVMGLILILICAMMTAIAIVREKETGTMEVLLASPLKPIYMILAKMIPYLAISIFNLTTILLLSVFILGVPVAGSLFWLAIVSIVFIFVALALGLMISTLVKSQVAAILVSGMGLMMPIMLLSGMIFPIASMPLFLQGLSAIIPARWYISAVKKLMISGLDVSSIWMELTILAGMAILLLTISLKKFKVRL